MKAVILAAGTGTRINKNREAIPKPLYEIEGKCLIEHVINNLKKGEIMDFVIIIGFMSEKIESKLGDGSNYGVKIEYIFNPQFEKPLGLSVLCSEKTVGDTFILSMSDHIIESEGVRKIVEFKLPEDSCALLVDKKIEDIFWLDDAAKVRLNQDKILEVSKKISNFQAVDCGVFKCSKVIFEEIRKAGNHPDTISAAVSSFSNRGKMFAVDIGEYKWIDIDEYSELEAARKIFKELL